PIGKNMQVRGDFLLAPEWRGVLDTYPLNPSIPMANMPFSGPVRWLMVRAPLVSDSSVAGGSRPLPFGAFDRVTPEVSIPVGLLQGQIVLDDGWDETPDDSLNVRGLFTQRGAEAVSTSLPLRYGTNRLRFVFPTGSFETFSMHYAPDTPSLVEPQI